MTLAFNGVMGTKTRQQWDERKVEYKELFKKFGWEGKKREILTGKCKIKGGCYFFNCCFSALLYRYLCLRMFKG